MRPRAKSNRSFPALRFVKLVVALSAATGITRPARAQVPAAVTAIVGATLIDGTGGAPIPDAVVVITGNKITTVGKRGAVTIPSNADRKSVV